MPVRRLAGIVIGAPGAGGTDGHIDVNVPIGSEVVVREDVLPIGRKLRVLASAREEISALSTSHSDAMNEISERVLVIVVVAWQAGWNRETTATARSRRAAKFNNLAATITGRT
jgi:hypothetical protein